MATGRELVKLRYHEWIDDFCPGTTQVGDGSVEQGDNLRIRSIRRQHLAKNADPPARGAVTVQECRVINYLSLLLPTV
jgi:hypothetical protein